MKIPMHATPSEPVSSAVSKGPSGRREPIRVRQSDGERRGPCGPAIQPLADESADERREDDEVTVPGRCATFTPSQGSTGVETRSSLALSPVSPSAEPVQDLSPYSV